MGIANLRYDTSEVVSLAGANVVPVVGTLPTTTGFKPDTGASAGFASLTSLATFFAANAGPVVTTSVTFSTLVSSATALATPSALAATGADFFASTVSGATLMGFGTTGDVTLKNRAGTDVLVVTSNSVNATLAGTLSMADSLLLTGSTAAPSGTVRYISTGGSTTALNLNVTSSALINFRTNGTVRFQVAGALGVVLGAAVAAASSANKQVMAVSAIADNTPTATYTVTVPNAAHSGVIRVTLCGSLGAGGAIGANEATGTISYDFAITRTAGAAAVVTASAAYGSSTAAVAGAATITITSAASAISGAVGATNTFTINVTIARGSGSSTNHTAQVMAELVNANATGISFA